MVEGEERQSERTTGFQTRAKVLYYVPHLVIYHFDSKMKCFQEMPITDHAIRFLVKRSLSW